METRSERETGGNTMASRITAGRSAGVLLIAGLLALSRIPVTSALAQSKAKTQTVTGFVGDTTCGITHISGSSKTCTLRCVKNMGAKYALVVGKTVYTLEGKEAELEKLAGERAKVTGVIQGTTLRVSSVASGKFTEAPDMD
jgi:hypothetical protein